MITVSPPKTAGGDFQLIKKEKASKKLSKTDSNFLVAQKIRKICIFKKVGQKTLT